MSLNMASNTACARSGPGAGVILQPVDQQESMQRDQVEPSIQRVRHAERQVEPRFARGSNRSAIQGDAGPLMPVGPTQTS